MFKMTASGYNALLKPSINGTANVLNYFNKDIAAGNKVKTCGYIFFLFQSSF